MPAASGICSSRRSRLSEWEVLCSALGFGESSSCVRFKCNQKLEAIVSARSRSRLLFNWQFNVLYQDRESRIGPKEEHGHTAIPVLSLRWCFWLHGQLHSQQTCTATGRGGLVPCCQRAALTSTRKETSPELEAGDGRRSGNCSLARITRTEPEFNPPSLDVLRFSHGESHREPTAIRLVLAH